ncbi:MAG: diphosphomevalonate decarboxylase [Candidatus Bathyarchaeia archaeon]
MTKATACAHTIQGLVKYHGLKNRKLRLPYHDSISVCAKELTTTATVDFDRQYSEDVIEINGSVAKGNEANRVMAVIDPLRKLAKNKDHFRLASKNNLTRVKGVGYSAAAFASIALAASTALNLKKDLAHLSEIARLGSGSASRSLVGGFAIWYANKNGRSFARQLDDGTRVKLAMGVVPLASDVKTEIAHEESVSSPFFSSRVREVKAEVSKLLRAIKKGDVSEVCRIAENDSLSLHAVTMTGKGGLVLMSPETINVIRRVRAMREEQGIPVWYSLDTGPSVFLNTQHEYLQKVCDDIQNSIHLPVIKSDVGGSANTIEQHLF